MIESTQLRILPATLAIARAELADRGEFARLLDATVPANWPPESAADALPLFLQWMETTPNSDGWFGWYAIEKKSQTLIGSAGFLGPPKVGRVEMGYSVLPEFQRRGYATELVAALIAHARTLVHGLRIVAETDEPNIASQRVLLSVGFKQVGPDSESGRIQYELAP